MRALQRFWSDHRPRSRQDWFDASMTLAALAFMALAAGRALEPVVLDWTTWGGHDWDEVSAQRYITLKSLREYGQLPFWNPFACGGHSAWANVQGASNLVSVFLPAYWFLDFRHALRVELVSTVIVGLLGVWFWAGRFTRSAALRGLLAVVFCLNGRWAMQAATGHAWHLYYAYTPWVFWAFERACSAASVSASAGAQRQTPARRGGWRGGVNAGLERLRLDRAGLHDVVVGAVFVALMVYQGAIYPLPQTMFALALYAFGRAAIARRATPLAVYGAIAGLAAGFAAPKLLPELEVMLRFPRLVDSNEHFPLTALVQAFTAPGQTPGSPPARVPQWGWHEYGIYLGWLPFLGLFLAGFARGEAGRSLRYAGVAAFALALGTFHEYAPWPLLHRLPLFSSQHVPSRWMHIAVLLLGLCAVTVVERGLLRLGIRRRLGELALFVVLVYVAFDVSLESNRPMRTAFWMQMRPLPEPGDYRQSKRVPHELQYERRDYAPEALPAMMTNQGIIDCTLMAAINVWAPKDARGRIPGVGAVGSDQLGYRGEAFIDAERSEAGVASIEHWSPNEVVVRVTGAQAGDRLVLNQNFDPGWDAGRYRVENLDDRLAVALSGGSEEVRFRFAPRGFYSGLGLLGLSVIACAAVARARRGARSVE